MEWVLEIVLVLMLAATLFHALRLERALGVLKRDRTQLEELVAEFNTSTRAAEASITRLHEAADGAGRQIGRHVETAGRLKDDLVFLADRGDRLADRLDQLVRTGRMLEPAAYAGTEQRTEPQRTEPQWREATWQPPAAPEPYRPHHAAAATFAVMERAGVTERAGEDAAPRVRSQAERDLMKALRLAR